MLDERPTTLGPDRVRQEVDPVLNPTPSSGATGVLADVLRRRSTTAPALAAQGTALSFAGAAGAAALSAAVLTIADAGVVAVLPGSPSRGAPV